MIILYFEFGIMTLAHSKFKKDSTYIGSSLATYVICTQIPFADLSVGPSTD